jgi:DNA phosphorothioation-associated DGQHR protein 1
MQLICAVFLDLPKPFQAQLFATINSTQKQVDRSLTFELFGYNIAEDSEEFWTPDKLAVFLTRKLGTEPGSPMFGRITVAPKRDNALQQISEQGKWRVSTAVVVDGVLRLFSNNPKRDSNAMQTPQRQTRSVLEKGARDKSPLRQGFIDVNDSLIYKMVVNYLYACDKVFWTIAKPGSYIVKTVGIQALFDVLRKLAASAIVNKDLSVSYFESQVQ